MDHLGLGFTLLLIVGLVLWGGLIHFLFPSIGRFLRRLIRGPKEFSDHGRERVGLPEPNSITSLVEERERRIARAQFRHLTRHSKDVA